MIVLVDEKNAGELSVLVNAADINACRISCLLESYGTRYDFAKFWLQYDDSGKPVSAAAKYYSDITVFTTENSDADELREFIGITGSNKFAVNNDSVIMRLVCREEISTVLKGGAEFVYTPDLNNVYRLLELCRESGFDVPQYEDFILDMSHKLRHGTSKCIAVEYKGEYAACAMTVAQSEICAVIGAVAVKKEYRRLGFGSVCVSELCRMLGNREIFIVRLKDRNKEFYEQLGFI